MSRTANGATVFAYLKAEHPTPRTLREIARGTGLSLSQARSGINDVRTRLGLMHAEPLICNTRAIARRVAGRTEYVANTYTLADDSVVIMEYVSQALRYIRTRSFNLSLVASAGADKTNDATLAMVEHLLQTLVGTCEFATEQLKTATTAAASTPVGAP